MKKENSHCRKPDCKYHPNRTMGIWWLKCLKCKHFVAKDNYTPVKKLN